jgi:hypothetical protein
MTKKHMSLEIPITEIAQLAALDDDQRFFAEHGYLILKDAFPEDLIDELANWSRARFWSASGGLLKRRVQDAWKDSSLVQQLAGNKVVLGKLEQLYERPAIPFQTLNFPVGTEQKTHSDTIHFHSFPQGFMCGVWVALEDITMNNGPLHYYPGSHRLPILDCSEAGVTPLKGMPSPTSDDVTSAIRQYERAIQELIPIAGLSKKAFTANKGDALIWAANLLHGGESVQDKSSTRLSQVTHYYFEGCRYYTPLLSDFVRNRIHFRDNVVDVRTGKLVPQTTGKVKVGRFAQLGRKLDSMIEKLTTR